MSAQNAPATRVGSSPRVRGTPTRKPADIRAPRFIPACAGNAAVRPAPGGGPTVHPRVCGERQCAPRVEPLTRGSSPRVRGTLDRSHGGVVELRFIPACAGNAEWVAAVQLTDRVHPRVCGERSPACPRGACVAGSSPRVRGTRFRRLSPTPRKRFIPACAGNAPQHFRKRPAVGGSSPRVRGTPQRAPSEPTPRRFIPACAGNAHAPNSSHSFACGSSPRVRGTP